MVLNTRPLSSLSVVDLLAVLEPADDGAFGSDGGSALKYRRWLEEAMGRAETASTRRLISDVLEDVRTIGPINGELAEVVLGALCSVELALEIESA